LEEAREEGGLRASGFGFRVGVEDLSTRAGGDIRDLKDAQLEVVVEKVGLALAQAQRDTCLVVARIRKALGIRNPFRRNRR
jgi:hypothetical protein